MAQEQNGSGADTRRHCYAVHATEPPLYMEFVGLPGSGKTTAHGLVLSALASRGCHVVAGRKVYLPDGTIRRVLPQRARASHRRVLQHARTHVAAPRLAIAVYAYLAQTRRGDRYSRRMARTLIESAGSVGDTARIVRSGAGDLVLHHQGFVAALRELVASDLSPATGLARVVSALSHSLRTVQPAFVVFDVAPEVAAARIEARRLSWGPYDRMPPTTRTDALAVQERGMTLVVQALQAAPLHARVLRVNAGAPAMESADRICAWIFDPPAARHP
jgi:thymidylate kinase